MTIDSLAFRTACNRINSYRDESEALMARHAEATECRDCEDFLCMGIEAFDWLARADEAIRSAVYSGVMAFNPEYDSTLAALYSEWLKPCEYAERWIVLQQNRGFHVDNLEEFRRCCQEARAVVEENQGLLRNDAFVDLRDKAIDAHRRGETLDFCSE